MLKTFQKGHISGAVINKPRSNISPFLKITL